MAAAAEFFPGPGGGMFVWGLEGPGRVIRCDDVLYAPASSAPAASRTSAQVRGQTNWHRVPPKECTLGLIQNATAPPSLVTYSCVLPLTKLSARGA